MIRNNDMPISSRPRTVTQIMSPSSSGPSDLSTVWLSGLRWTVAMAKRAYPIVLIFALFATALAATIALRLAIWLPMYLHHGNF
jgi:hypothetical protein